MNVNRFTSLVDHMLIKFETMDNCSWRLAKVIAQDLVLFIAHYVSDTDSHVITNGEILSNTKDTFDNEIIITLKKHCKSLSAKTG